jgi:hypothetical protein
MTRASWGSTSGDYSGFFAGLIDENRRRIEESVQRDINRSKEQQNAQDNEMYDKWQNGIISDREWLAYVHDRVEQTKGDPTEHQKWVQTWHEQRNAVVDAEFEARYEAGDISIHKLIAHYSDRLASVKANSPAYRDTQQRYFQLIDTRDSNYIEDEANRILNRIQRGQAGYGELRDFYQSMLGKVRKSSPLYRQIKQNLQSIANIGGATGGSGGGGGGGSRSGGGGGGDGSRDPYSTASKAVLKLWKSGNVFVPQGNDVVESVLSAYNMNTRDDTTVWNALAEDSVVMEDLMNQAKKNPNAKFLVTNFGEKIPNTLENRHLIMNQALRNYDFRIALGNSTGKSVLGIVTARSSFVDNTFGAENDATVEDYWKQHRQDFWEGMELANQQPDPTEALNMYAAAGKTFRRAIGNILGQPSTTAKPLAAPGDSRYAGKELPQDGVTAGTVTYKKSPLFPEQQVSEEMQADLNFGIQLTDFLQNAPNMTPEELQHESSILFDSRPSTFYISESDLKGLVGTDQTYKDENGFNTRPIAGTGIIGKAFAQRGLVLASQVDQGFGVGTQDPYRYVSYPGLAAPIPVPESKINDILQVKDWKGEAQTVGGMEKVNGRLTWVIRPLTDVDPPKWWFNKNTGRALTADQYDRIGHNYADLMNAGYEQQPVAELSGWKMVKDGDGIEWYRDPNDGFLYQGSPPFATRVFGPVFDYADFVDNTGHVNMEAARLPASTGKGYIAYYTADVSGREAQDMIDEMVQNGDPRINLSYFHRRDDKNNFITGAGLTPDDVAGMYNVTVPPPAPDEILQGKQMIPQLQRERQVREHEAELAAAETRRRAEVQDWIQQRIGNARQQGAFEAANPDINLPEIASRQIEQAKEIAGIKLGNELRQRKQNEMQFDIPELRPINAPPSTPPPPPIQPVSIPTVNRRKKQNSPAPRYAGKVPNIPTF